MKKLIQLAFLTAIPMLFLTGCLFGGFSPNSDGGSLIIGASRDAEDRTKAEKRSRDIRGQCEDNNNCIDICEDTYGEFSIDSDEENDGRVERCLTLSYSLVDSFEDITEALEDPAYSKLRNLEPKDFGKFLDVSLRPWIEYIKDMRRSDSEIVLRWIASERQVAVGIEAAYDKKKEDIEDYDGVYKLFMDLAPDLSDVEPYREGDNSVAQRPCAEFLCAVYRSEIGGNKTFTEIVSETRNTKAQEIVDDLLEDVCDYTPIENEVIDLHLSRCP